MEKREAEILVRLSMWRQCCAICVKQAIYFSRSWRECPQRNFGREESDSVSLLRALVQRSRQPGSGGPRSSDRLDTCCRADVAPPSQLPRPTWRHADTALSTAIICTKGKFEMLLTHHLVHKRRCHISHSNTIIIL